MADLLTNVLNSGQYSSRLRLRNDFAKKANALKILDNANVVLQGGVERRSGTELLLDREFKDFSNNPNIYKYDDRDISHVLSGPSRGVSNGVQVDDRVYYIPRDETRLVYYNKSLLAPLNTVSGVVFDGTSNKFINGLLHDNKIYFTPDTSLEYGYFDLETNAYINDGFHGAVSSSSPRKFFSCIAELNNRIYYFPADGNRNIYRYNTGGMTQQLDIVALGVSSVSWAINVYDNYILFGATNSSDVYSFDGSTATKLFNTNFNSNRGFKDACLQGNWLVLCPDLSNTIFAYNVVTGVSKYLEIDVSTFTGCTATDIGVLLNGPNSLGVYDVDNNTIEVTELDSVASSNAVGRAFLMTGTIIPTYSEYSNAGSARVYNRLLDDPEILNTELYMSIAFPKSGNTGSDHIIMYTDKSIMVYDIDNDSLSNVEYVQENALTERVSPPKPMDFIILNDIVLFTCENNVIHQLTRKFDSTGVAYFEFDIYDINNPVTTITSDNYSTANVGLPISYITDANKRWVENDYFQLVDSVTESNAWEGYEAIYGPNDVIDNNDVGSRRIIVVTSEKFNSRWVGGELGAAPSISIPTVDKWYLTDGVEQRIFNYFEDITDEYYNPNTVSYGFIPDEVDLNNESGLTLLRERYLYFVVDDKVNLGNTELKPIIQVLNQKFPDITENDVINKIANDDGDIKKIFGSSVIGRLTGSEDNTKEVLNESDVTNIPEPTEDYDQGSIGFIYPTETTRVSNINATTSFSESFGTGETVDKIVEFGVVLGDWTFSTGGNWDGSITLQSNNGNGWITISKTDSVDNNNVIINDGTESNINVRYRVILDFQTDTGSQAVDVNYAFDWDSYNAVYTVDSKVAKTFVSTYFVEEPVYYYESIVFHQNRIWLSFNSSIYASDSTDLKQFASYGIVTDSSPIAYRLADTQSSTINWLFVNNDSIIVGTTGGLWGLSSESKVLTTQSTYATRQTAYSVSDIKPINVGSEMMFVDASNKRIYATIYDYTQESLNASDITVFASDMFDTTIKEITYDEVNKLIYVRIGYDDVIPGQELNSADQIVTISYDKIQNVIACNGNTLYPYSEYEQEVLGKGYADGLVYMNNRAYLIKTSRIRNPDFTQNIEITELRNDINGEYYINSKVSKSLDNAELKNAYVGKECYYRSTLEKSWSYDVITEEIIDELSNTNIANSAKPILNEKNRYDYLYEVPDPANTNYYNGIEIMFPLEMFFETFELDYGVGSESTFGSKKNVTKVRLFAENIGSENSYSQFSAENKEYFAAGQYNDVADGYLPQSVSGEFNIPIFSRWNNDLVMTIFDSSPHKSRIDGFVLQFSKGG